MGGGVAARKGKENNAPSIGYETFSGIVEHSWDESDINECLCECYSKKCISIH